MSGAKKTSDKDFKTMGLTPPEQKLWRALEAGDKCVFDKDAPEEERTLRGEILGAILRRDAIEGVTSLAALPRQIRIACAIITGQVDMSDIQMNGGVWILSSSFDVAPNFSRSTFAQLSFEGSEFDHGARFDDVITKGDLWLDHTKCNGELSLVSVKVGGQFAAESARFSNPKGNAINAQGAQFKHGVFLRGVNVIGCAFFMGAEIDFQFVTEGARFFNPNGDVITLQGAQIKGVTALIKFPFPPIGDMNFTNANLRHVVIDENSYPLGALSLRGTRYSAIDDVNNDDLVATLDGWFRPKLRDLRLCYPYLQQYFAMLPENENLTYKELTQKAYEETHLRWRQSRGAKNHPFAYRQFARVLKANGHDSQSREVRIEAEHEVTKRNKSNRSIWWSLWRVWRFIIKYLIAYGIKPWRIIPYVLGWVFIGFVVFYCNASQMTPSKERFYLSENYVEDGGYAVRADDAVLPEGYPTYNSFTYSLDVMLPVVDFAQESHWRPKNTKGFNWLRIFNRFFLAVGWALSTIAVLGFTGVIADRPIED